MEIFKTSLLLMLFLLIEGIAFTKSDSEIESNENINRLNNLMLQDSSEEDGSLNPGQDHARVKRHFGYYPYGYYPRPLPVFVGGIGIGIARPGFGYGFGRGFGFGRPGFGRFGGRGFGGRGFGGFGGFGRRG